MSGWEGAHIVTDLQRVLDTLIQADGYVLGHVPQVGVEARHPDQLSAGSLQQHLLA